jgi:hypothetical protein
MTYDPNGSQIVWRLVKLSTWRPVEDICKIDAEIIYIACRFWRQDDAIARPQVC